jgi:hypothetical protein
VFVEGGERFLNPTLNLNTAGFGDMVAGFKWAFLYDPNRVVTFQLKSYIPTGDADRGLGTDHYSVEPGFLLWERLVDEWVMSGEFRYWIPVDGTDFAGSILIYGLGLSYGLPKPNEFWLTPVVEVVGWTVLDGKESQSPPFTPPIIEDAAGDTIVNLKLGGRVGFGNRSDFYVGWGRALTGNVWYKDIVRLEYRLFF